MLIFGYLSCYRVSSEAVESEVWAVGGDMVFHSGLIILRYFSGFFSVLVSRPLGAGEGSGNA